MLGRSSILPVDLRRRASAAMVRRIKAIPIPVTHLFIVRVLMSPPPSIRPKVWSLALGLARELLIERRHASFNELLQPDIHLPAIAGQATLSSIKASLEAQAALTPILVHGGL